MMNEQQKAEYFEKVNNQLHIIGRILLGVSVLALVGIPFLFGYVLHAPPQISSFLKGLANVAIIYYPVTLVEYLIFAPMLGVGGTYLAFITGNLTNLKIPCAMNARDIAKTKEGTPENEIISTLSIASSALVTMVVIFLGVMLLTPLKPVLEMPALAPAFNNVVAALFGALGLKYFVKQPKLAVFPLVLMGLLCILVPSMIHQTSILIIPAGLISIGAGLFLQKKGIIRG